MTVAATLRSWAADADEEMAAPLRELADQYDAELQQAKQDTERECLAPIAEALSHPEGIAIRPETFAVLAAVRGAMAQMDEDESLRQSLTAKLEALEAAEAARLKKREQGRTILAEKRQNRIAALEQLVQCLITLREVDVKGPDDDERAAYERHISDLRAAYGRDHKERD